MAVADGKYIKSQPVKHPSIHPHVLQPVGESSTLDGYIAIPPITKQSIHIGTVQTVQNEQWKHLFYVFLL